MLRDKPAGSFIVRNSNTFQGAFGLALKVAHVPPNVQIKEGGTCAFWGSVLVIPRRCSRCVG